MAISAAAPKLRTHPRYAEGEELGAEISELCAYMYAATYRLLELIRRFDDAGHWQLPGLVSCAHWLNLQCGIGLNAAREKVRVAHALAGLPKISAAFRKGELSYSKVRAMTRVANADNEDALLMIARHGTAHHVEKLVAQCRRAVRLADLESASEQHARRELSCRYDEDGSLVIHARLPAEQGALFVKALEMAMDRDHAEVTREDDASVGACPDGRPSEGPDNPDVTAVTRAPLPTRRADALIELADTYLNAEPGTVSTADRYQVVVHVTNGMDSSPSTNRHRGARLVIRTVPVRNEEESTWRLSESGSIWQRMSSSCMRLMVGRSRFGAAV